MLDELVVVGAVVGVVVGAVVVGSGPCDTTMVTVEPGSTSSPGAGSVSITRPAFTVSEKARWRPR